MNFLALLGWAPDGETTIMSRDELVERFSLERVGASPATFDYAKLDWMNGVYLRALPPDEYADRLVAYLRERGVDWDEERVRAAARDRPGEDRALRRVRGLRGLPLPRRRAGSGAARRAHSRRRGRAALEQASSRGRPRRSRARSRRCATSWGRSRARSTARSASRSPARACRRACTRASSCSARTSRSRASGAARRDRALADLVGVELGPTSWIEIPQERIDTFARGDRRPAVDPRRPRARRRRPVRDDDRARLPHAVALRPDAVRALPAVGERDA